jgi:sugar phosphate isomerase/epimerase
MNRRDFLKTTAIAGVGTGLLPFGHPSFAVGATEEPPKGAAHAEKFGWRLGCQAWTFNQFTFFEAVDKTASLGLHYIEAFPGQRISKALSAAIGVDMAAADRKEVLKKLADSGVKMAAFGVGGCDRKHFEFAKQMGIETLTAEPDPAEFDAIDKLSEEFGVNLAIHNHPKPSRYWNPDIVLAVCKDRSKRIGACADTGHWARSGLIPLDCLKKLEGRIISFHFKDLDKMAADAHDVPWGTGVCNAKRMLTEIRRQNLKALFSAEYEFQSENLMAELGQCVKYFERVAVELDAMELNMPGQAQHLRRLLRDHHDDLR